MRLGKLRVELQSALRGSDGFRNHLARRQVSVPTQQIVGVGKAGQGQCVVGIFDQGQFEVVTCLLQPDSALVPEEATLQIQLVGFRAGRLQLGERLVTATGQAQFQRGHDRTGNVVLDLEHILHLPVEALRPQAEAVGDIDQLGRDAELVVRLADAAFQQRLHAKRVADLADVFATAFERKAGGACYHMQSFYPRESVQQVLTDPVAQKLVFPVGADVHERQHRNGFHWFAAGLARRRRHLSPVSDRRCGL